MRHGPDRTLHVAGSTGHIEARGGPAHDRHRDNAIRMRRGGHSRRRRAYAYLVDFPGFNGGLSGCRRGDITGAGALAVGGADSSRRPPSSSDAASGRIPCSLKGAARRNLDPGRSVGFQGGPDRRISDTDKSTHGIRSASTPELQGRDGSHVTTYVQDSAGLSNARAPRVLAGTSKSDSRGGDEAVGHVLVQPRVSASHPPPRGGLSPSPDEKHTQAAA